MNLELVHLTQPDIFEFYPIRRDAFSSHKVIDMVYDFRMLNQMGPLYALRYNEKCIAILGVAIISRTAGHVYMAGSDYLCEFSLGDLRFFIRTIRKELTRISTMYNLHRLQLDVDANNPVNIRFAKWLGFKQEGYCPKYYEDGSDALIMGKVDL